MAANERWRVRVSFVSSPDDPDPVYVDVTADVEDLVTTQIGETAETSGDTGSVGLQLSNVDQRYTPGNVLGPYHPIKADRRIVIDETIDDQVVELFNGWVSFPEIPAWTQSSPDAPRTQVITLTAVDRLVRTARQRMISTLGEFILHAGAGTLTGFWPLTAMRRFRAHRTGVDLAEQLARDTTATATGRPTATDGGGDPVTGDDVATLRLVPNIVGSAAAVSAYPGGAVGLMGGETVTMQWWVYWEDTHTSDVHWRMDFPDVSRSMGFYRISGNWTFDVSVPPVSFAVSSLDPLPTYKWCLVGLHVEMATGLCEMWVDREVWASGTLSGGVIPAAMSLEEVYLGAGMQGNLAYLQIHVGAYTRAQHIAQYEAGLTGLEGQTTGERVRTLLEYGGVAGPDLTRIDRGVSLMRRAALAGRSPIAAAAEAVETEQGDLYAAGDGRPVFADRIRRYNV